MNLFSPPLSPPREAAERVCQKQEHNTAVLLTANWPEES